MVRMDKDIEKPTNDELTSKGRPWKNWPETIGDILRCMEILWD